MMYQQKVKTKFNMFRKVGPVIFLLQTAALKKKFRFSFSAVRSNTSTLKGNLMLDILEINPKNSDLHMFRERKVNMSMK